MKGLESVAGGFDAVFVVKAGRDGCGTPGVERFFKHGTDFPSDADGCVVLAEDGAGDFEAAHTAGVVGLVMRVGHDELRLAGFEALRGGSYAALVDDERSVREELGVGSVLGDADGVRQWMAGTITVVIADEQDGAHADFDCGAGGVLIEAAGGKDGGGTEGEDERCGA